MSELASHLLSAGLVVAITALCMIAVRLISRRLLRSVKVQGTLVSDRHQQLVTVIQLLGWIINVILVIMAILMLLSNFDIDIAPLLASAGVAGLAISLGAQTLIKDLIGGLLVLIENQYSVGDTVQVGAVTGQVERLTLRTTAVRDVNGALFVIPNGEVRIVANLTRGWSRALVDIGVAYEADMDHAIVVLTTAAEAFAQNPAFSQQLLETPQVLGAQSLGDSAITVRVMVKTQPGQQWSIARELRRHILAACESEGVDLPYPRQEILVRHVAPSAGGADRQSPQL